MTTYIYRPVYFDHDQGGYYYQKTARSPLRGPFSARYEAVADALWVGDDEGGQKRWKWRAAIDKTGDWLRTRLCLPPKGFVRLADYELTLMSGPRVHWSRGPYVEAWRVWWQRSWGVRLEAWWMWRPASTYRRWKVMTKKEVLRALNAAKAAVDLNKWDTARCHLYRALTEVKEREVKTHKQGSPHRVRVKAVRGGYRVYMGGVPHGDSPTLAEALYIAKDLVKRYGGELAEVPEVA